jgi:acetylornithine/succinyldiaminopimelate/putrescine aminotransferase
VDKESIFSIYSEHVNAQRVAGWRRVGPDILEHRREGFVWDVNGRRYIDCYNSAGVFNVGRANHPYPSGFDRRGRHRRHAADELARQLSGEAAQK